MAKEEGQAEEQPEKSAIELAQEAALSMIQKEEGAEAEPEKAATDTTAGEGEAEAAEAETEEAAQPERYKFTVKADDGSDVEVEEDVEGLKKGYMLEKSYRQKTAQLARTRETVEAEKAKAITEARSQYDEKLATAEKVIQETLAPELKNVDWAKLAAENPAEYVLKFQQMQAINSKLTEIQSQRRGIAEQQRSEAQATVRKQATEAVEVLQTKIPQWNNDLYGKILKQAIDNYGFKAEEVGQITDPRAIEVLHDAMQFRALKAKPIVDKRVAAEPKPVLKAGGGEQPDTKGEGFKNAMAKLTKTGDRRDAVALAAEMIRRQGSGY